MGNKQLNIVLNDLQGLYNLLNKSTISLIPREGNIKLELDGMNESEKIDWQKKLQQYYFACGCKEGSVTSMIFFFLYWIYIFVFEGVRSIMNWEVWVTSVLFLFIGAIVGKAAGLFYSRYALTIAVRKLILTLSRTS